MVSNLLADSTRLLLAVASPVEFKAVLQGAGVVDDEVPPLWETRELDSISILHTGVGKANAAGAVARELTRQAYGGVLSIGLAGSFDQKVSLCTSFLGINHYMLDEGAIVNPKGAVVKSETGWMSIEDAGWATVSVKPDHGVLMNFFRTLVDNVGDVGTVSTISGTNDLSAEYQKRFKVRIETMESGAIAQTCSILKVPFADIRVISNFCGERTKDNHDFPGALKKMAEISAKIFQQL
ncbi:MAG: hypothetical protein SGJ27_15885 [Candidatus Melainabacteria bacterium]|nr:hypothetical protein [Candidatus Melainabacteria bacterium]